MKNSLVTIEIDSLAAGGDGVGRLDGVVCFVPLAAPGDRLEVRIVKVSKRFIRGQIERIIRPGDGRRDPPCPLYGRCGGCNWLHLLESRQLQAKRELLRHALKMDRASFIASPAALGYRSAARFQADPRGRLGFNRAGSRAIQDVGSCPIMHPRLNECLPHLRERLLHLFPGRSEVRLVLGEEGPIAVLFVGSPPSSDLYRAAEQLVPSPLAGILISFSGSLSVIAGEANATMAGVDGEPFVAPAASFGQANRATNYLMVQAIESWLSKKTFKSALELFSGAGNLTVALARHVPRLATGDLDDDAVKASRKNLQGRKFSNVISNVGDALEIYLKEGSKRELLVLDPPRGGHLELSRAIAARSHRAVVYISCNPATLARDVAELRTGGFRLREVTGFDMFPQTSHMEVVALLERDA